MDGKIRQIGALALSLAVVAAASATQARPVAAQEGNGGSGGRARVLVAPLQVAPGIDRDFGKKVAEEVEKQLGDFPTLTSVESKEIRDELRRLKLREEDLGLVQWRQLAGRLNASVVMFGQVAQAAGANQVNVVFVDSKTGDELQVPEFTVVGEGRDQVRETAGVIVSAFQGQVDYQRALLFCQDYLAAEQFADALRNCNDALELNPGSTTGRYLRGRVHMGLEEWEAAQEDLVAVVEENPAEVLALQSLAFTELKLGNKERSVELYREYLNFNPGDASVRLNVAFELAQAGGEDQAISLLQDGIAIDSTNADLWEFLGNVALRKGTTQTADPTGDPSEAAIADEASVRLAVDAYNQVLALRGDQINPEILRNVVAANLELGDYDAALDFADRAQSLMPEDASLWSIRADVYGRMERFGDAVASLDRTLQLDPSYPQAKLRRGFFKLQAGDSAGAIADLRVAVQEGADPDIVAGQLLARGYNDFFKSGQYEQALAMFRVGTEFAQSGRVRDQLYFFTAYGYYQQGVQIDSANESAEACEPAQRALRRFQEVIPNLNRAGSEQPQSQAQIRESTDVYIYRQEQIIRKNCR